MAEHDKLNFKCRVCGEEWPQGLCAFGKEHDVETITCPEHPLNVPCPEPGSNKHNPYN